MIDTLLGLITSNTSQENETASDILEKPQHRQRDEPMISYAIRGQVTLMSNWEDPYYFTGAFPTLFPTGLGGHKEQRPLVISLEAFVKWTLSHHSRKYFVSVKYYKLY